MPPDDRSKLEFHLEAHPDYRRTFQRISRRQKSNLVCWIAGDACVRSTLLATSRAIWLYREVGKLFTLGPVRTAENLPIDLGLTAVCAAERRRARLSERANQRADEILKASPERNSKNNLENA